MAKFICVLLFSALFAQAQERDAKIAAAALAMKPALIDTRRDFHRNPELSNREERTGRVIAERLRALGFDEVRYPVARHGVVGVLKGAKPGPVVAWRSDMDALPIDETMNVPYKSTRPGVKHACGHDGHMAVALGLAELLSKMRGEIQGTVKFLFQPAEEGPPMGEEGGAPLMIKEGALENPKVEAVFALHVSTAQEAGTVGYVSGPALSSSDTFRIKLKGRKSHGAFPHEGNDAVLMATACIQGLYGLKARRIDAQQPVVLGIGTVHGGDRFNVVAEEVTLEGTLRTFDQKTREEVRTQIRQVLTGCTAMQGGSFELAYRGDGNPSVFNDPKLTAASVPHLERVFGKPNVILGKPAMVSEDFSYYQLRVPGFFFWLGVGNQARGITAGLHTAEMDLDEDALPVGVRAAAAVLLGYLDGR